MNISQLDNLKSRSCWTETCLEPSTSSTAMFISRVLKITDHWDMSRTRWKYNMKRGASWDTIRSSSGRKLRLRANGSNNNNLFFHLPLSWMRCASRTFLRQSRSYLSVSIGISNKWETEWLLPRKFSETDSYILAGSRSPMTSTAHTSFAVSRHRLFLGVLVNK